jgi:hypothetical protein
MLSPNDESTETLFMWEWRLRTSNPVDLAGRRGISSWRRMEGL